MMRKIMLCGALLVSLIMAGCGGGSALIPQVTISPTSATLKPGETQQFTVSILGATNVTVIWKANGVTGGDAINGTISNTGLYTAPATPLPNPVIISVFAGRGEFFGGANATVTLKRVGVTLSGILSKGPIGGATVTAFDVNVDGTSGPAEGSATTDTSGAFTISTANVPAGPIRLSATGGTYVSELDGSTITNTGTLTALLKSVPSTGASGISVGPMTTLKDSLTMNYIANGIPTLRARSFSTYGADFNSSEDHADKVIKGFYGIPAGVPLEFILPKFLKSDITDDAPGFTAGVVHGAILCLAGKLGVSVSDLVTAITKDISDGIFDGKFKGAVIVIGSGPAILPSTIATTDFLSCVNDYINKGKSPKDHGITPSDVKPITDAISGGVAASTLTPASTGLAAGSSGAISSLSFTPTGGTTSKQILFVAARSNGIGVVDITDPAAPPTGKHWSSVATLVGGPVGGVIPVVGKAGHAQVFAYAYGSKTVALLNADTLVNGTPGVDDVAPKSIVDFKADLPLKATSVVSFSGGSAFIAGGIPFGGGIWLATADGYAFFDLTTNTLGAVYPAENSQMLAENVGGDVAHNLIFAGNYRGIQIVDLTAKKSIYMDSTSFTANVGSFLGIIDADSVDSGFQVGIMTPEDSNKAMFLNLKTIVRTAATTAGGFDTFVPASTNGTAQVTFTATTRFPVFSGSAVDSSTHLALFMAGYSTSFGVGMLQDPTSLAAGATWQGLTDYVTGDMSSALSAAGGYCDAKDPHADGVIFNNKASSTFGYLLNGCKPQVVQIDMKGVLALARDTSGHSPVDPTFGATLKPISF